jgi:hypothetical protein
VRDCPGRSKDYRQMARLGVPYAMEMDFKAFGFSSTVTRGSVEAIPDAVMAVPADYQVVKKN